MDDDDAAACKYSSLLNESSVPPLMAIYAGEQAPLSFFVDIRQMSRSIYPFLYLNLHFIHSSVTVFSHLSDMMMAESVLIQYNLFSQHLL